MRRRILLLVSSCVLLILCVVVFGWVNARRAAPIPIPSTPGGYYADAFTLRLTAPSNGKIYYTTDGSTPTADSTLYEDGIPIKNRSSEPNLYTSIQNVTTNWKDYSPDPTPVEKGTVIRAIFVNDWGRESEILTQTYFVGITPPARGYTLSLIFEYDDLFGDNGIYVTGAEYDEWYLSGELSPEAPLPNFEKRLEVMVTAEMMDNSGDILNQPVGLRLQGNSARGLGKKRMILTAREEYGGSQVFDAPLFEGISSHSVMLKYVPIDAMVWELAADRAVSTQQSVPVRLFLNGEYWQDTYMLERYDQQYFRQHYNVSNRVLVKDGITDEESLASGVLDNYGEFMFWAEHTNFGDAENYSQLQLEMDIQSYIDYVAVNYYLCNYDFSQWHNYVLWRSPIRDSGAYQDLRWRWCIYDIDALFYAQYTDFPGPPCQINIFNRVFPQTDILLNQNTLFVALKQNPESRRQFVLSFMDIGNNNFAPEKVAPVLEKYGLSLDWNSSYFRERPACAAQYLAEEFGLTGSLETVTVTTAQPEMGCVQVNTSVVDLSDGSWSGQYFTDYPITVTAIAGNGYQFLGWKGDANGTEETLTVSVDGGVTLEAEFAKIS